MARPQFHVTYEIVTPESAEHGDAAERGFAMPGGWQYAMPDDMCGPAAAQFKSEHALELREAIGMMSCCEDCDHWFSETDSDIDYATGAETRRSLHCPDSITPASYDRVARLLGIRRVVR